MRISLSVKRTRYRGDEVSVEYNGERLATGKPVSMHYTRNKDKAGYFGSRFGQDIEPTGQYIHPVDGPDDIEALRGYHGERFDSRYEAGVVHFKNPLVLEMDPDDLTVGWKRKLSNAYGGKTGRRLSKAVIADGYDGIITVNRHGPSETVNLQTFK